MSSPSSIIQRSVNDPSTGSFIQPLPEVGQPTMDTMVAKFEQQSAVVTQLRAELEACQGEVRELKENREIFITPETIVTAITEKQDDLVAQLADPVAKQLNDKMDLDNGSQVNPANLADKIKLALQDNGDILSDALGAEALVQQMTDSVTDKIMPYGGTPVSELSLCTNMSMVLGAVAMASVSKPNRAVAGLLQFSASWFNQVIEANNMEESDKSLANDLAIIAAQFQAKSAKPLSDPNDKAAKQLVKHLKKAFSNAGFTDAVALVTDFEEAAKLKKVSFKGDDTDKKDEKDEDMSCSDKEEQMGDLTTDAPSSTHTSGQSAPPSEDDREGEDTSKNARRLKRKAKEAARVKHQKRRRAAQASTVSTGESELSDDEQQRMDRLADLLRSTKA